MMPVLPRGGSAIGLLALAAALQQPQASPATAPTGGKPASEANPLASLPALRKVHHSTAIEPINSSDPVMLHYARVTHSLGMTVYWAGRDDVKEAVKACRASDNLPPPAPPQAGAAPAIRCSIAANYNPWGEDGSPFPKTAPPTQQGPLEAAELQMFKDKVPPAPHPTPLLLA